MRTPSKALVAGLAFCVMLLPISDLTAAPPLSVDVVKKELDQYGLGANLKLKLEDGKTVKGSLIALGDDGLQLRSKPGAEPRLIAYNKVSEVRPAKLVYRAKGQVDPHEARRVVLGLHVGHHIQVKTTAGKEYHGNIQAIDSDTFTMLPDHQASPVQISFTDVQYVEQNLSKGAWMAIALGLVGFIVLAVILGAKTTG